MTLPGKKPLRQGGFTLFEIMFVVIILGIVATLGLPTLQSSLTDTRLSGAATEIITALEFGQTTAMSTGGLVRITLDASSDSILVEKFKPDADLLGVEAELDESDVEGGSYSTMGLPTNKGTDYSITFSAEDRFSGVDISSSTFGAGNFVIFDGLGAPSGGGTVTLSMGSSSITLTVNALNGKVTTAGS